MKLEYKKIIEIKIFKIKGRKIEEEKEKFKCVGKERYRCRGGWGRGEINQIKKIGEGREIKGRDSGDLNFRFINFGRLELSAIVNFYENGKWCFQSFKFELLIFVKKKGYCMLIFIYFDFEV